MKEITKLAVVPVDRTARPQPQVIRYLEELLGLARAGELQSIVICSAHADGASYHGLAIGRPGDTHLLATAILCMQHDFVCKIEQQSLEIPPTPGAA